MFLLARENRMDPGQPSEWFSLHFRSLSNS